MYRFKDMSKKSNRSLLLKAPKPNVLVLVSPKGKPEHEKLFLKAPLPKKNISQAKKDYEKLINQIPLPPKEIKTKSEKFSHLFKKLLNKFSKEIKPEFEELKKEISPVKVDPKEWFNNLSSSTKEIKSKKLASLPPIKLNNEKLFNKAPLPPREISTVSDFERMVRLLERCKKNLKNNDIEFAEFFYIESQPLFKHLTESERQEVYPHLLNLRDQILMERMELVKNLLKKS